MPAARSFSLDDPAPPDAPTPPAAVNGSDPVAAVADDMAADLPEPQQHAIDEATKDATGATPGIEVDALGVPWNPEAHATGRDGKGVKTAKGVWRRRKGVGGSASTINTRTTAQAQAEAQPAGPSANEIACRRGGMMAARLQVQLSVGIMGNDYLPRMLDGPGGVKLNELEMLEQAWGDYFVAKDFTDLPPGWALCGALAMYYLPRFQMPTTKEKARGFFAWCKAKYASFRMRRHGLKAVPTKEPAEAETHAADAE